MAMSWCDYQRAAQGYIIRNARYLDGVRKLAAFTLAATGAKRIRETALFRIATDSYRAPEVRPEDRMTPELLNEINERYFGGKKGKAWRMNRD